MSGDDERINSGVSTLDQMLEGEGIRKGSIVLIKGEASSRKDLFGYHFLKEGLSRGERVVFYDVEASSDEIMDIHDMEEEKGSGKLIFVDACPRYSKFFINAVPARIIEHMDELEDVNRVLINPLTFFVEKFGIRDTGDFLIMIRDIAMKKDMVVVFLMADILSELEMQSIIDKCDGIIELDTNRGSGGSYHTISIQKFGRGRDNIHVTYVVREGRIMISTHQKIS